MLFTGNWPRTMWRIDKIESRLRKRLAKSLSVLKVLLSAVINSGACTLWCKRNSFNEQNLNFREFSIGLKTKEMCLGRRSKNLISCGSWGSDLGPNSVRTFSWVSTNWSTIPVTLLVLAQSPNFSRNAKPSEQRGGKGSTGCRGWCPSMPVTMLGPLKLLVLVRALVRLNRPISVLS